MFVAEEPTECNKIAQNSLLCIKKNYHVIKVASKTTFFNKLLG